MIRGATSLIAHIGFPTHAFKAPMIYNPYFEQAGIDAVVVPMGCEAPNYATFLRAVFTLANIRGALITMPHKVSTVALLDDMSPCSRPSGPRRTALHEPAIAAVGNISSSRPTVLTLCGMVISAPRMFDILKTERRKSG